MQHTIWILRRSLNMSSQQSIVLYNSPASVSGLPERKLLDEEADEETVDSLLDRVNNNINIIIKHRLDRHRARREERPHPYKITQPSAKRRNTLLPVYVDIKPTPDEQNSELRQAKGILSGTIIHLEEYLRLDPRLRWFYIEEPLRVTYACERNYIPNYEVKPLSKADRDFLCQYINIRK